MDKPKFTPSERDLLLLMKANPNAKTDELARLFYISPVSLTHKLKRIYPKVGLTDDKPKRGRLHQWLVEHEI